MYGSLNRTNAQNAKARLADSYARILREIVSTEPSTVGNYTIIRQLGEGSFGKIYLAVHKLTHSKVVLKAASKNDPQLVREIHHHRLFKHNHIAQFYEFIITESTVWLVIEYCPGDDLYLYLVKHRRLSVDETKRLFAQICGAVAYTHSKHCTHRDLKLENILLDKHNDAKLTDFGFTREYPSPNTLLETICGTTCYMAPEMLAHKRYTGEAIDVWSLGVICYTLLYGEMPFEEDTDLDTRMKVLTEEPTYPDPSLTGPPLDLLKQMLSKDPRKRPTVEDILKGPWLGPKEGAAQIEILNQPEYPLFSTKTEKRLLRKLQAAQFDVDAIRDSVYYAKCDPLAGTWALALRRAKKVESKRTHHRHSISLSRYSSTRRDSNASKVSILRGFSTSSHKSAAPPVTSNNTNGSNQSGSHSLTSQVPPPQLSPLAANPNYLQSQQQYWQTEAESGDESQANTKHKYTSSIRHFRTHAKNLSIASTPDTPISRIQSPNAADRHHSFTEANGSATALVLNQAQRPPQARNIYESFSSNNRSSISLPISARLHYSGTPDHTEGSVISRTSSSQNPASSAPPAPVAPPAEISHPAVSLSNELPSITIIQPALTHPRDGDSAGTSSTLASTAFSLNHETSSNGSSTLRPGHPAAPHGKKNKKFVTAVKQAWMKLVVPSSTRFKLQQRSSRASSLFSGMSSENNLFNDNSSYTNSAEYDDSTPKSKSTTEPHSNGSSPNKHVAGAVMMDGTVFQDVTTSPLDHKKRGILPPKELSPKGDPLPKLSIVRDSNALDTQPPAQIPLQPASNLNVFAPATNGQENYPSDDTITSLLPALGGTTGLKPRQGSYNSIVSTDSAFLADGAGGTGGHGSTSNVHLSPAFHYTARPRPISQISQFSGISQISTSSQVSDRYSFSEMSAINVATTASPRRHHSVGGEASTGGNSGVAGSGHGSYYLRRPYVGRRSTSSSFSSIQSITTPSRTNPSGNSAGKHKKTHVKASSLSSLSLKSGVSSIFTSKDMSSPTTGGIQRGGSASSTNTNPSATANGSSSNLAGKSAGVSGSTPAKSLNRTPSGAKSSSDGNVSRKSSYGNDRHRGGSSSRHHSRHGSYHRTYSLTPSSSRNTSRVASPDSIRSTYSSVSMASTTSGTTRPRSRASRRSLSRGSSISSISSLRNGYRMPRRHGSSTSSIGANGKQRLLSPYGRRGASTLMNGGGGGGSGGSSNRAGSPFVAKRPGSGIGGGYPFYNSRRPVDRDLSRLGVSVQRKGTPPVGRGADGTQGRMPSDTPMPGSSNSDKYGRSNNKARGTQSSVILEGEEEDDDEAIMDDDDDDYEEIDDDEDDDEDIDEDDEEYARGLFLKF